MQTQSAWCRFRILESEYPRPRSESPRGPHYIFRAKGSPPHGGSLSEPESDRCSGGFLPECAPARIPESAQWLNFRQRLGKILSAARRTFRGSTSLLFPPLEILCLLFRALRGREPRKSPDNPRLRWQQAP